MSQRPKYVVLTTATDSAPVPVNRYPKDFSVGVGVKIVGGTATYSVQHTFDDIQAPGFNPATAKWYDHATLVAQTTDKDGNYFAPPRAIRLRVSAIGGGATVTMALVFGG